MQFLNTVFLPVDQHNDEVYENVLCSMGDILAYVWKYSYLLEDKNPAGFSRWCSGKGIDFLGATVKRKKVDAAVSVSVRSLHVLKEKYIGKTSNFYLLICIH